MFKSILLAVDASHYSEVCTRYALEYAQGLRVDLRVLSVLDRKEFALVYPYYYPTADFPPVFDETVFESSELYEKQKRRAEEVLQRIERDCRSLHIAFHCDIREGIVSDVILEEVKNIDLLFMGLKGSGAEFSSGWLGSNLANVVRRSRLPVIVTPKIYRPLQKILVCFDGSECAVKALRAASHLTASCPGKNIGLRLLVVQDLEEAAHQIAEKAIKYLESGQPDEIFLHRKGEIAKTIVETAQAEDADLVVMGAYGHSRVREILLGSTTERVLRTVNRALLLHH